MEALSLMLETLVRILGGFAVRVCGSRRMLPGTPSFTRLPHVIRRAAEVVNEVALCGIRGRQDVGRRDRAIGVRIVPLDRYADARNRCRRGLRRIDSPSFLGA